MPDQFKPGDVVRLKRSGPPMTVEVLHAFKKRTANGPMAQRPGIGTMIVARVRTNGLHCIFPLDALERVD